MVESGFFCFCKKDLFPKMYSRGRWIREHYKMGIRDEEQGFHWKQEKREKLEKLDAGMSDTSKRSRSWRHGQGN